MIVPELEESDVKTLISLHRKPISVDDMISTIDGVRALEYLLYLGLVDVVNSENYSDVVVLTEKGRKIVEIIKTLIESGELDLEELGLSREEIYGGIYIPKAYRGLSGEDLKILLLLYLNGGKLKWYQLIRAAKKRPSDKLLVNKLIRQKKIKPRRGRTYTLVEITKEGIALLDTMFSKANIDPAKWIKERNGFKTPSPELICNLSKMLSPAE